MNKASHPSYNRSFLLALSFHCMVLAVIIFSHTSKEVKPLVQNPIISAQMITDFSKAKVEPVLPKFSEPLMNEREVPKEALPETPKIVKKNIDLEKQRQENQERQEREEKQERLATLQKEQHLKLAKLEEAKQERLAKLELQKEIAAKLEKEKQERIAKLEKERQESVAKLEKEQQEKIEQERRVQAKQEQEQRSQIAREQAKIAAERLTSLDAQRAQAEHLQLLRTIDRYALLMRSKIHQNWRRPVGIENLYKCKVVVKLRSNGEVISAIVVNSSGNVEFDRSAELAVRKSSPLPMPPDEKMKAPFNNFTFTFEPETV